MELRQVRGAETGAGHVMRRESPTPAPPAAPGEVYAAPEAGTPAPVTDAVETEASPRTRARCGAHAGQECLGSNVKWRWNVIE